MKPKQKIALITGASNGLGLALAKKLISLSYHVIAIARSKTRLMRLDDYARSLGSFITIVPLDLQDTAKIKELGVLLANKFGQIDLFIPASAIIYELTPLTHLADDKWQEIINVNLSANFYLFKILDPLLKNSANAKIIMLNDQNANQAYFNGYGVTKAALSTMANIYAAEVANISNIKLYNYSPPPMNTKLVQNFTPDTTKYADPAEVAANIIDQYGL